MQIEYYKKQVYGNDMLYIKDPAVAAQISSLTGQKTISMHVISTLFKVEFIQVLN